MYDCDKKPTLFLPKQRIHILPCKSTTEEVSFELSHLRISSIGSKVRTTSLTSLFTLKVKRLEHLHRHVYFVSRILHENFSPRRSAFFHLGNRADILSYEPTAELVRVTSPARSTELMWIDPKGYLHTIADSFSGRQETLSGTVWAPIQYVTLHFRYRRGAASLDERNCAEIATLICEQKPYLVRFSCRDKSYPAKCEHSLSSL